MKRRVAILAAVTVVLLVTLGLSAAQDEEQQYLEFRTYQLSSAAALPQVDAYLEKGLLPALERQGIGTVGVFTDKVPEGAPNVYVLIPFSSIGQFSAMQGELDADSAYQSASAEYFDTPQDEPRFARIESELMLSFKAFPRAKVPEQKEEGKARLFELRSYESHSEKMGALKVEMFNSGEVPIFLDCDIQPVFMGRVLSGPKMPNLTYMTVYSDEDHLEEAWAKFGPHPDWQKLRAVEKYQETVSKIHKTLLTPRPYSAF